MTVYIPVILWLVGSVISYWLMHKRGVKLTLLKNLLVAFLGPISIPVVFLFSPQTHRVQ